MQCEKTSLSGKVCASDENVPKESVWCGLGKLERTFLRRSYRELNNSRQRLSTEQKFWSTSILYLTLQEIKSIPGLSAIDKIFSHDSCRAPGMAVSLTTHHFPE